MNWRSSRPQPLARPDRRAGWRPSPCPLATAWESPWERFYGQETKSEGRRLAVNRTSFRWPAHHEPRLRSTLREQEVLHIGPNLEPHRVNGLDAPAFSDGG